MKAAPAKSSDRARVHPRRDPAALLKRLRRMEGQVRGVSGMIETNRPCVEVLTQIAALRAALASLAVELTEEHLRTCVAHSAHGDEKATEDLVLSLKRLLG